MNCPYCHTESCKGTWRSRVRRGDKVIWVQSHCWVCSKCRTPSGAFQYMTPDLEIANEALATTQWKETFDEPIPPPLPGVRIRRLMRTPEGKRRVAEAFGKVLEQQILEKEQ